MKDKFANSESEKQNRYDLSRFNIRVEDLKDGRSEKIKEEFSPDFIDVSEERLSFHDPVYVSGDAYLADQELILRLDISTFATIPCSICNEPVKVSLDLEPQYFNVPMAEVKNGVYSLLEILREAILIETPAFAECNLGNCPKRTELAKYLKKPASSESDSDGYRPFEDLKID